MNINDISRTAIDFTRIILKEENEWDDRVQLIYTTQSFNEFGFIVKGSHVLKVLQAPVYVDDSNKIESYEEDLVWNDFKIYINDYKDTDQMYKSIKLELYEIIEKFNENLK
ncbi:hypothetical protein ACMGDK_11195 [Chryseobacterium sp. DT-3]|uniref:hypothetical protein n=1 Tax=Chryseobacterium sp. DT-3 TaxID=3396164 RepID=UPI003F1DBE1F